MSNYTATIVRITNLTPHPNADRLQITNIQGNTVIVGMDTKVLDLGIYFPLESQLSEEFCKENDLVRRKDDNGKVCGGMLESNRRIRAIKLRGIPSMGLYLPLTSLKYIDTIFHEGQEFSEIKGHEICKKYIPSRTQYPGSGKPKEGCKPRESRIIPDQFRFHFDTAQLGKNIHKIQPSDLISITWKLHGTSAICGNILTKKKLGLMDRVYNMFGMSVDKTCYDYIYASRRVVKNSDHNVHYYTEDLWTKAGKEQFEGKLHHGETVYYEIVGYTSDGGFIQKGYDYKVEKGTYKVYVYRITYTTPNGTVVELQWNQVKERCAELGVAHVPEILYGDADIFGPNGAIEALPAMSLQEWQEQYLAYLKKKFVHDQDCQFCENKVPSEGICVRKEGLNIEVFKLKNFRFQEHETKALDNNELDLESTQSE